MIIDSPIISGSQLSSGPLTQVGDVYITGSLNVLGAINGSITGSITSASYATNAEFLDRLDSTSFVFTSSFNTFSGSAAGRITDLEAFSSSLDATFATDASVTASILVLSGSVQASQAALSSSYTITSGSYASASSSLSIRTGNLEATSSTLVSASSSFAADSASLSTRLTGDETNITTLTSASGSFAAQSASLSTRVTNLEVTSSTVSSSFATTSGSLSTRVTNLESTSSTVSSSFATTSGSISGRVTLIEGQYATTGSNTFTGPQFINQASNAISFTSTASLYTPGGARISKDLFVSGTSYFNNVVVYGTSSIQYITSSQVNFGTNIITVNTDTPAVRFGGLAVYDSGSTSLTGSMLWDSEKNNWIYSNPSGSTYNSAMLMNGPRNTGSLGNEQGTTACALMMGQGGDHITSSMIYSYGNATCFYGQSYISGSGDACFSGQICSNTLSTSGTATFSGCVNVNTGNQIRLYNSAKNNWVQIDSPLTAGDAAIDFKLTTQSGILYINNTGVACFNNAICAPRAELTSDASCVPLRLINGVITGGSTTGVTALYFGDAGSGVSMVQREKYAANQANLVLYSEYGYNTQSINACFGYNGVAFYTAGVKRQSIDASGITCFAGTVCAPSFIGGTTSGTTIYGSTAVCSAVGKFTTCIDAGSGTFSSSVTATSLSIASNTGGITLNRTGTSNYSTILYQSAAADKWYVGMRENNATSDYILYNATNDTNTLRLSVANNSATFSSTITGTTIYGSTAVCAPVAIFSGCVGIGTTTPNVKLTINAGSSDALSIRNADVNYENIVMRIVGGVGFISMTQNGGSYLPLALYTSDTERMRITSTGIACFACQVCAPVLRASNILISNYTQVFDGDFSLNVGVTRSVVLCGGIYTLGDFHLMTYGNAGTGMSSIRLSTYGYFANSNLLGFCEQLRYTFGSMAISGVSNNGTSISFNIANCSGSNNATGFWRMISLMGDSANSCIDVYII